MASDTNAVFSLGRAAVAAEGLALPKQSLRVGFCRRATSPVDFITSNLREHPRCGRKRTESPRSGTPKPTRIEHQHTESALRNREGRFDLQRLTAAVSHDADRFIPRRDTAYIGHQRMLLSSTTAPPDGTRLQNMMSSWLLRSPMVGRTLQFGSHPSRKASKPVRKRRTSRSKRERPLVTYRPDLRIPGLVSVAAVCA